MRRRPAAGEARLASPDRRRTAGREHPQVSVEAAQRNRLCPGAVFACAVGATGSRIQDRCRTIVQHAAARAWLRSEQFGPPAAIDRHGPRLGCKHCRCRFRVARPQRLDHAVSRITNGNPASLTYYFPDFGLPAELHAPVVRILPGQDLGVVGERIG